VWVTEVFIRWQGEDICFWAAGDQHYLTDPKPVRGKFDRELQYTRTGKAVVTVEHERTA